MICTRYGTVPGGGALGPGSGPAGTALRPAQQHGGEEDISQSSPIGRVSDCFPP